jgi:hypothetical protein
MEMSTRRAPRTLSQLFTRGLVAFLACAAGFAPFTHIVSASVAPIVFEDGGAKTPTTVASDASMRRRRRPDTRSWRRAFDVRAAMVSVRSVAQRSPAPATPLLTILRL